MKTLLLLALFLFLAAAPSAEAKSINKMMTYEAFAALVRDSASRIPDLDALWSWSSRTHRPVYMGGGALRGLLHWLYKELQTHKPAEIRAMPIPAMEDLLLQEWSDLDLFAADGDIPILKQALPQYAQWDILKDTFHQASVNAGGTTLEKTRVSPGAIDDPLGGLRDYYEGKLVFKWTPDAPFRRDTVVTNNTRLAQAIRYLRIGVNLPEAKLDATSYDSLDSIPLLEANHLVRDSGTDYWIEKALKKLYHATKRDLGDTLDTLRRAGLLEFLRAKGYAIKTNDQSKDLPGAVDKLMERGWTIADFKAAELVSGASVDAIIEMLARLRRLVKTGDDYLTLTQMKIENPSAPFKKELRQFTKDTIEWFFEAKPSLATVKRLYDRLGGTEEGPVTAEVQATLDGILERGAELAATPAEFIDIFSYKLDKRKHNYDDRVIKKLEFFLRTKPSIADIKTLQKNVLYGAEAWCQALELSVPGMKSAAEYLKLIDFNLDGGTPSQAYRDLMDRVIKSTLGTFLRLKPTAAEVKSLEKMSASSVETKLAILMSALPLAQTPAEYLTLFTLTEQPPRPELRTGMEDLILAHLPRFLKMRPSITEIAALKVQCLPHGQVASMLLKEAVGTVRTFNDVIAVTDYQLAGASAEIKLQMDELAVEAIGEFIRRAKPNTGEVKLLEEMRGRTASVKMRITELALATVKSPADFLELVRLTFEKPGETYRQAMADFVAKHLKRFLSLGPSASDLDALRFAFGADERLAGFPWDYKPMPPRAGRATRICRELMAGLKGFKEEWRKRP